jgi:hypothetical protein
MILVVCIVLGIVFNATIGETMRKEQRFAKIVKALEGKSLAQAKAALGKPFRTNDMTTYKQAHPGYVNSLEPDPPIVECDQVYQYQEYATLGFLFVRKGTVVQTYVGGT